MRRHLSSALLLLAVATAPVPAQADPVRITSGFFASTFPGRVTFGIAGEGFEASGSMEGFPGPATSCIPCLPGEAIDVGWFIFGAPLGGGPVTIGGTLQPSTSIGGEFDFRAPRLVVPSALEAFTHTAPFAFSGVLVGLLDERFVFEQPLFGRGTLTASFFPWPVVGAPPEGFNWDTIRYDFTAEPVPEPATLLLFGTGAAAVLRWRRRGPRVSD